MTPPPPNPFPNTQDTRDSDSCGGRLVATDGRNLPLKETRVTSVAEGGIARTKLEQTFANPYDEPLEVTYLVPLPADGAVSGFSFQIGDRRVVGEVDRRKAARERYERALSEGRSAAILDQERTSLFMQSIGNIPPHTEVVAEILVDQRLLWRNEGSWELRFPTTVAPRYQGEPGRVIDARKLNVPVADKPLGARMHAHVTVRDKLSENGKLESPSHEMRFDVKDDATLGCLVAEEGVPLDRDWVVRWPVAQQEVGVALATFRPGITDPKAESAYGMLTIVPPQPQSQRKPVPRDLTVLLDTSGSMSGEPLNQAKNIVAALIGSLDEHDRLELIEFAYSPRRFRPHPEVATEAMRTAALAWLRKLEANGATEMKSAVQAALQPLRAESQRQVVLVTDGLVGFESEIVATILRDRPKGVALHMVGVGCAVNSTLSKQVARAGHGIGVVVDLGEDPNPAVRQLLARTQGPVVTDVELSGTALVECAPNPPPDLFAGAPVLVGVELRPEGGTIEVKGRCAESTYVKQLEVKPFDPASGDATVAALYARERVEDLEMLLVAQTREREGFDRRIETLGLQFQISTRLTSWVAISEEKDVDPRKPTRKEIQPHEVPHGMSEAGLGLRSAPSGQPSMLRAAVSVARSGFSSAMSMLSRSPAPPPAASPPRSRSCSAPAGTPPPPAEPPPDCCPSFPTAAYDAPHDVVGDSDPKGASSDSRAPIVLKGRVTLLAGKEMVFELLMTGEGLEWAPVPGARVYYSNGDCDDGKLVMERTTAPGTYTGSQVLRVVVLWDHDIAERQPLRVWLRSHGQSLLVHFPSEFVK